jgi:hypothetical protein
MRTRLKKIQAALFPSLISESGRNDVGKWLGEVSEAL